jgi:outer membrane lipoprotein SlyB
MRRRARKSKTASRRLSVTGFESIARQGHSDDKGGGMRITAASAIIASGILLTACASQPTTGQMISSTQGSTVVRRAQVTDVRDVTVQGNRSSGLGSFAGAILGGVAGSMIGSGNGRTAAGIGGALAGGMAGQHAEQASDIAHRVEVTVRFDNGDVRSYPVEPGEAFRIGDMVTVSTGYQGTHIKHE